MAKKYSFVIRSVASGLKSWLLAAVVTMVFVGMTSCSDDGPEALSPDPSVEETETGRVTSFSVASGHFSLPDGLSELSVALTRDNGDVATYNAEVMREGNTIRFSMLIPKDEYIADGDYIMTLSKRDGGSLPGRLMARFADGRLESANPVAASYPLKGAGTSSDPYLIGSSDDFGVFVKAVNDDDGCHGAGLVFLQSADLSFTVDDPGHGYLCDKFAGIYDGGGKTVTMEIKSEFSGVGMFGTLMGSASVSNLRFSNISISGERSYSGIVAGKVTGDVIFDNLDLNGVITGDSYVGSLAGCISGGNVVISCITAMTTVVGRRDFAGGLVGRIETPKSVIIKDCSVSSPVGGMRYVGGAFGDVYLDASTRSFEVDGLGVSFTLSGKGVSGYSCVGGLSGRWHWVLSKKMYISGTIGVDISVEGSQSEVGGLFGTVEDAALDMDAFIIGGADKSMSVRGIESVGGAIGKMTNSSLYGSQYFDLESKDKSMPKIPKPTQFKSSFDGTVKGLKNVGGLVGYMADSQLLHISSGAKIAEGGENIGGLVGYFSTSSSACCLSDCVFTGELNASSAENTGGLIGFYLSTDEGLIEDCVNYSPIVGGYYTGGIIGYLRKEHDYSSDGENRVAVRWAVNAASIEGSYNVGGIIGRTYSADTKLGSEHILTDEIRVTDCMNCAEVIARGGNSEEALGGIVGRSGALTLVTLCANHGHIEGRGKLHAIGGIVGRLGQDAGFSGMPYYNSFATEDVNTATINSTDGAARVGGIAGYGEEGGVGYGGVYVCGITNCRNSGKIEPDQKDDTGGILGFADNWILIASNFNRGKVMHGNALLGTQKTNGHQYWGYNYTLKGCGGSWPLDFTLILSDSGVTNQANFTDFDFENIWEMTSDGPNLRNNRWRDPASAKM